MQVNLQTSNNNTSFGKLIMSTQKQTAKIFGEKVASEVEAAREPLKNLAKDVNIYVNPGIDSRTNTNDFKIFITEKVTNPFKLFSGLFKYSHYDHLCYGDITSENDLTSSLIKKVEDAKEQFLKCLPNKKEG